MQNCTPQKFLAIQYTLTYDTYHTLTPIVCTNTSMNSLGSTIAFFNEPVQIFIEMLSEPRPQYNATVFLIHNTEALQLTNNMFYVTVSGGGDARLVWQFIVQVPDLLSEPNEGVLRFTADFQHENTTCRSQDPIMYSIPVYHRSGK